VRVAMMGCGRVGLVTACGLAYLGHDVVAVDKASEKIEKLQNGLLPLYEPHLEDLVQRAGQQGHLSFSLDGSKAIQNADVVFLCIGVRRSEDGNPDLSSLESVARVIAAEAKSGTVIVQRSTMPVQTGKLLREMLSVYGRQRELGFSVAVNPQFLREGTAIHDFLHADRILLGIDEPQTEQLLRELYRPIIDRSFQCPLHPNACSSVAPAVVVTTVQSAELIKHASNAFLAMKISYANLLAELCDRLGGDIGDISHAMGQDPRIGPAFLEPGLGFGGLRLPRDLRALIKLAEQLGVSAGLLKEVERINARRVDLFLEKIRQALWIIKDKEIGVLGLSFKPDTDDIRSSPAISLIQRLIVEGATVRAYDPRALQSARENRPEIEVGLNPYEIAERSEALVIATPWNEFRRLDWRRIHQSMLRPLLLDGCNLLNPAEMRRLGFEYYSCGRPEEEAVLTV
jgi:UDPglucose 6-dehydrogenase